MSSRPTASPFEASKPSSSGSLWSGVRIVLALALAGAAITLIAVALNHLVRAGTCASGGPYQSNRQCPKGTGTWMFAIPPALIALFAAPILSGKGTTAGRVTWVAGFVALGLNAVVLLVAGGLPPEDSSRFGALVLAVTFLSMGLIPGAVWTVSWFRHRDDPPPVDPIAELKNASRFGGFTEVRDAAGMQSAVLAALAQSGIRGQAAPRPGSDPLDRLQQLAALRDAGVLTHDEFEAQKARILSEG